MDLMNPVTALLCSLMVVGCTGNPVQVQSRPEAEQLIVRDFVNVLLQVEQLRIDSTTLHIPFANRADDPFGAELAEQLAAAGYAIRMLAGIDPAEKAVSYDLLRTTDPDDGEVNTYTISVGPVSMRRSYAGVDQQRVRPVAPMQLKGVDSSGLRLSDELFQVTDAHVSGQGQLATRGNTRDSYHLSEASQPSDGAQQRRLEASAVDSTSSLQEEQNLPAIAAPAKASLATRIHALRELSEALQAPRKNVRDLGESNFVGLLDTFGLVRESVLTFDNDSLHLSKANKARINSFVEKFDPETDVFSVIGCSNGATGLAIGQQGLAMGRADVVKQELMVAGVAAEKILEEGCWAGESYDERMPRRGVVLSMKRRAG